MTGDYIEKQHNYSKQMQEMYSAFDEATDHRFHDAVQRASDRTVFLSNVNIRDFKEIYKQENRPYLHELSRRDRFYQLRTYHAAYL